MCKYACAPLMGAPLFLRWCDVLFEAALVDSNKCYCPYQNCNELIVNECGGNPKKSNCPRCKRSLCFQCKRAWHWWFIRCEKNGDVRDGNDVAFGLLAKRMRCPRCRHCVELTKGCSFIKCRCGIEFCYLSGKQVHDHLCFCQEKKCCMYCFSICSLLAILCILIFAVFLPLYLHFSKR